MNEPHRVSNQITFYSYDITEAIRDLLVARGHSRDQPCAACEAIYGRTDEEVAKAIIEAVKDGAARVRAAAVADSPLLAEQRKTNALLERLLAAGHPAVNAPILAEQRKTNDALEHLRPPPDPPVPATPIPTSPPTP